MDDPAVERRATGREERADPIPDAPRAVDETARAERADRSALMPLDYSDVGVMVTSPRRTGPVP